MKDRFRVAVGFVDVAAGFEPLAIIGVVVDLAVVDYVQRTVFVGHRLMTGGDVDDTQAAMAQTDVAVDEEPFVVRTAMPDDVAHRFELRARDHPSGSARKRYSVNAAH